MRQQVVEIDLLLSERPELGNQISDRSVQPQRAPLDERQREHVGELLRHRHGREHGVFTEAAPRVSVGGTLSIDRPVRAGMASKPNQGA